MICPFGREVGEPPKLENCEVYGRGCSCHFELLLLEDKPLPTLPTQGSLVRRWWDGLAGSDRGAVPESRETG